MKRLSHTILSVALACTMYAASATDFGGMLTNDSKFAGNDFGSLTLDQKNALSAWIRVPFNDKGTTYFTAEGLYQFEYKDIKITADESDAAYAGAVDLDLFKFGTAWENADNQKLTLSVGRFFASDLTGLVYGQNADGFLAAYESPAVNISLYGAYTGLLNARTVSMVNSIFAVSGEGSDAVVDSLSFYTEDTEKHYQRAEEYVLGGLTVAFPNVFANQTISAQFLGGWRLQNERYNRLYAELGISGPIVSTLFYTLQTAFGFYSYDGSDYSAANLSKLALTYFGAAKNLAIGLNATYASGANGGLDPFIGFTSQTATNALSGRTEYTGLIKTGVSASVRPITNVLVGATADIIFNAADSVAYEGVQYGLNANWQIVSDVSVGATFYQYYDTDDSDRNKSCIQLKAAISF